ncbi:MAG: 3-deoxy-8-phosphooctulonate synthase [Hyphomicrobiales bacterium]|nr:3-deoxy-8-phosphooctulonate synthase [Hyphomicrobiales bacterium]MCP5000515.1 3-deoxy-8-phosphooctulonate synthase [Hyphomicrobiales bacterium]
MSQSRSVQVGPVTFSNDSPFVLIAGPCQIESRDHAMEMAAELVSITDDLGIPYVYKSSYDKANRSSVSGKRGIGMEAGLQILADVREKFGCPVITDIHESGQAGVAADAVDILQIPAYLCRQTDLLVAAGETGKAINVKKGQFLAPWEMGNVAEKIATTGNGNILLCERGTTFGYNTLVNDFRGLPTMAETGYPVVFDATHSVQQPGAMGSSTGGQREFAPVLARAALAVGCAAVFMETHENPDVAPCDGPNMIPLGEMKALLVRLQAFDTLAKQSEH